MNNFTANITRPQQGISSAYNARQNITSETRQNIAAKGGPEVDEAEKSSPAREAAVAEKGLIAQAARQISEVTQNLRRDLSFEVDRESGRVIIQVYDSETQELIRTIPPEETRALLPGIEELAGSLGQGLFVRTTA